MTRPVATVELAMDVQVAIRDAHRASAPLWEAAIRTGDRALLARCKELAGVMRTAQSLAREIAGLAEPPDVPVERAA